MIILGIDPGTASTGYGAVSFVQGKLEMRDYGVVRTAAGEEPHLRLRRLYDGLISLFEQLQPVEIAVEQLFFSNNVRTALAVGEARGVALLAAASAGCEVREYTPLEVKQSVVGYGRATKAQVQFMVKAILKLEEKPKPDDAADGLALAICHAHSRRMKDLPKIALAGSRVGRGRIK